ncbi:MAG: hypothetical protein M3130_08380 [Actinomycetota bacterium]|nr:hypothetical protein [Actinomycetota bacterium]
MRWQPLARSAAHQHADDVGQYYAERFAQQFAQPDSPHHARCRQREH